MDWMSTLTRRSLILMYKIKVSLHNYSQTSSNAQTFKALSELT